MPFSAHDLRDHLDQHYASLIVYLQHRAQRYLGTLAFDAKEVDQVVGHVIEQLTHLHILGGGDHAPETALDHLTNAQFYALLNRCVKNKSIDRLRRHRSPTSALAELERSGAEDDEAQPMEGVVETLWGTIPFATPEETALEAASRQNLRQLLKHCIEALSAAPVRSCLAGTGRIGRGRYGTGDSPVLRPVRQRYAAGPRQPAQRPRAQEIAPLPATK